MPYVRVQSIGDVGRTGVCLSRSQLLQLLVDVEMKPTDQRTQLCNVVSPSRCTGAMRVRLTASRGRRRWLGIACLVKAAVGHVSDSRLVSRPWGLSNAPPYHDENHD